MNDSPMTATEAHSRAAAEITDATSRISVQIKKLIDINGSLTKKIESLYGQQESLPSVSDVEPAPPRPGSVGVMLDETRNLEEQAELLRGLVELL